jgi:thioesterase domain-containing protein
MSRKMRREINKDPQTIFDYLDNEEIHRSNFEWLRDAKKHTPAYFEKLRTQIAVRERDFVIAYVKEHGSADGLHPDVKKYAIGA